MMIVQSCRMIAVAYTNVIKIHLETIVTVTDMLLLIERNVFVKIKNYITVSNITMRTIEAWFK